MCQSLDAFLTTAFDQKKSNQSHAGMSNLTTNQSIPSKYHFILYYPLLLVILGTTFNFFTFLILCQSIFKNTKLRPTLHYMRTIALFDILMLYGWNFDHYLLSIHGFTLQRSSIVLCKFFSFLNYFSAQVSAWLRVFICLDRYISLSQSYGRWSIESKNILRIILAIIVLGILINSHFLIFACYSNTNGTVNPQARLYRIYPLWDYVNLALYNICPFILMVLFNSGVLYHLIRLHQTVVMPHRRIPHRSITITLVITTFLFLMMTTPATILFAFFYKTTSLLTLYSWDSILYTYHILSFPLYFLTLAEFRRTVVRLLRRPSLRQRLEATHFFQS